MSKRATLKLKDMPEHWDGLEQMYRRKAEGLFGRLTGMSAIYEGLANEFSIAAMLAREFNGITARR